MRETGPGPYGLAMEECAQGLGGVERSRHSYCMIDRVRGWDGSWSCSLIGLDKAIFDQQVPRYEMCCCYGVQAQAG